MARSILFCSIFPLFLIVGCGVTPPPYVIDVEKLAGVKPAKAEQLLKEMIPTQLINDCRLSPDNDEHSCVVIINCWEVAKGQIPDADAGRINSRTYSIGNGQITAEGEGPDLIFNFDEHLAPNVDTIIARFRENVAPMDALRRLGYDPDKRIKQANWSGWYFITDWHVHRVAVENREGGTESLGLFKQLVFGLLTPCYAQLLSVYQGFSEFRGEMNQQIAGVRSEISDVRTEISKMNQNHIDHLSHQES